MPAIFDIGPNVYDERYNRAYTVGATAIKKGQLVKLTAGLLVPAAADDKQLDIFVAISDGAIGATNCVCSHDPAICFTLKYTGAALVIGTAYGIDAADTVDQTDTTNKLVIPTFVWDSTNKFAQFRFYRLPS